jgi:hypothetical protein
VGRSGRADVSERIEEMLAEAIAALLVDTGPLDAYVDADDAGDAASLELLESSATSSQACCRSTRFGPANVETANPSVRLTSSAVRPASAPAW